VIGAGGSGLTAAALIARAGRKVVVLERGNRPGGALFAERRDGFLFSSEGYASHYLDQPSFNALNLGRHGVRLLPARASYALSLDGAGLTLPGDDHALARALGSAAPKDAERLAELKALIRRQEAVSQDLARIEPPKRFGWRKRGGLILAQGALQALGAPAAEELLRFWSRSLGDLLDEYFESPLLKAALALRGLIGVPLSPFAPGTAARLMEHPLFARGVARDGLGTIPAGGGSALAEALAAALQEAGGELRLGVPVSAVLLENGHAAGVVLESGEEVRGNAVISSLDVKRTFMTLFDWESLPKPFLERVAKAQAQGTLAKIDLALDEAPVFPALPPDWMDNPGDIHLVSDMKALDTAYRRWLAQLPPESPPLIISVPSLIDRSRAPARHHVMSVTAQFVPGVLFDGAWTAERRQAFVSQIFDQLKAVSPGLTERVRDMRLLLPTDIEAETGLTGGGVTGPTNPIERMPASRGTQDQQRFVTPVPGLYLCEAGSAAAGLSAEAGQGAANAVLGAMKVKRR
jgi:phytoene dehydrogenase-like protein